MDFKENDIIHGFELRKIVKLDEYHSTAYHFIHKRTGLEVLWLSCQDRERFFSYIFRTVPSNDKGIPHMIEHSVLAGSEKYPVADPFMEIYRNSAKTYMNAATYSDKTMYLAASPLEKDFDNIFDVYTDAVFKPLLKEETFKQEGIRLTCDENFSFSYDGVVFNEMLGARMDHTAIANIESSDKLFPDNEYSFDAGGDSTRMIDLKYNEFLSFYEKFYHASNCRLFLYGDMEIEKYLRVLDEEYLAGLYKVEPPEMIKRAARWTKPRTCTVTSPGGDDRSTVSVSWLLGDTASNLDRITASLVENLLIDDVGSPFYRKVLSSKLCDDLSPISGLSTDKREMVFALALKGCDAENAQKIEDFVISALKQIVKKGFSKDDVRGVIKRLKFSQREIQSEVPTGKVIMTRCLIGWMYENDPFSTISAAKSLDLIEKALKKNSSYFENWITDNLISNQHRCTLIVKPDRDYKKNIDRIIQDRISTLTRDKDRKALEPYRDATMAFLEYEEKGDDPEALKKLPKLTLDDIPREIYRFEHEKVNIMGVPVYGQQLITNGICYFDLIIHTEDLSVRELQLLPLYCNLIQMANLRDMDYTQISTRMKNLTGSTAIYTDTLRDVDGNVKSFVRVVFQSLTEDFVEACEFIADLFRNVTVTDRERINAAITDAVSKYESYVPYSGHVFSSLAARSMCDDVYREHELTDGISQWLFLKDIGEVSKVSDEFGKLKEKLTDRRRFEIHVAAEADDFGDVETGLERFLGMYEDGNTVTEDRRRYEYDSSAVQTRIYSVPSSINFNAYAIEGSRPLSREWISQSILANIITGSDLWDRVRGIGGAYGVAVSMLFYHPIMCFYSFRDPRIGGTYRDYMDIIEKYSGVPVKPDVLEDAKISACCSSLRPKSPAVLSNADMTNILSGLDNEKRTRRYLETFTITEEDIRNGARILVENQKKKQIRVSIVSPEIYEKERGRYPFIDEDEIVLPL